VGCEVMEYFLRFIEGELDHYQKQAKGLRQYGKSSAGQMDFEKVIILKLVRETLEARQRQCKNCEHYDNPMLYCSLDGGGEWGESEWCSRWEERLSDE
jgi:hypothetical protein